MTTKATECALCGTTLTDTERTACNECLDELYHVRRRNGSVVPTVRQAVRRYLMRLQVAKELREMQDADA